MRHSGKKSFALASAMWVSYVMELVEQNAKPAETKGKGTFFQTNQNAGEPEPWALLG